MQATNVPVEKSEGKMGARLSTLSSQRNYFIIIRGRGYARWREEIKMTEEKGDRTTPNDDIQ